jgi:Lrp/AsnC family transcriptional regulator, regulator for asnA, asnC and gidA
MNALNIDDLRILAHLRQDSRRNLTSISKQTLVPISTIFDRLKKYNLGIIKKNTILIDFKKLGYELKVNILVKTRQELREDFRKFAEKSVYVNSMYRINNGYDFMIEAVFRNMVELEDFNDKIEKIGIQSKQEYYILEDIKKEAFISQPDLVELMTGPGLV